ncbi:MAG: hypothetical protein AAGC79_11500 [Pseudomonadota bacterium]
MSYVVFSILLLLVANALIAFGVVFYWQARVIFTVLGSSGWDCSPITLKDLANPNGANHPFCRFIAGKIFPELRRKWAKAIGYVAVSFLTLFLVFGFLEIFVPEHLP